MEVGFADQLKCVTRSINFVRFVRNEAKARSYFLLGDHFFLSICFGMISTFKKKYFDTSKLKKAALSAPLMAFTLADDGDKMADWMAWVQPMTNTNNNCRK
jgi:hypothetical protein